MWYVVTLVQSGVNALECGIDEAEYDVGVVECGVGAKAWWYECGSGI